MKILVIGTGGREHALVWKIAQSPRVKQIFCAPGNAGIGQQAERVPIGVTDVDKLAAFAAEKQIDLTVVGPEASLCAGVADTFQARGLPVFGSTQQASQLEGSKVFAKQLLLKYQVPTAEAEILESAEAARACVRRRGAPIVVKADGLAAGKGVIVCPTVEEAERAITQIMEDRVFGEAGARVVVEECLQGDEVSVLAFVDGHSFQTMEAAQDHKRALDNDQGPNTGGMGAYSPTPVLGADLGGRVAEIFQRTLDGLRAEGIEFKGVMYAGLMLTVDGPKVLEYNCRFGDPEAQVVLPRMDFDLVDALEATIEGRLDRTALRWKPEAAVCVVMASGGYPGPYERGIPIQGLDAVARLPNVVVYHAGTKHDDDGRIVTDGGRVLGVTALGDGIAEAARHAYGAVEQIHFDDAHYRRDIAARALRLQA